jgi:hypothetical protein
MSCTVAYRTDGHRRLVAFVSSINARLPHAPPAGSVKLAPAMTSPDTLTNLLDTYMDLLGLVAITVVVVWLVWQAFR